MNIKTKEDIAVYQRKRQLEINKNYHELSRSEKNSINSMIKVELKLYKPEKIKNIKYYNKDIKQFIKKILLTKKSTFTADRNNYIYFLKNDFVVEYHYIHNITDFLPSNVNLTVRLIYILEDIKETKKCDFCGKEIINVRMNCSKFCKKRRGNDKENTIRKNKVIPDTNKSLYQKQCRKLTEETYKNNIKIINPLNKKRGRSGVNGAYQLDHIISIEFGWLYNIPPEVIADISNLQLISWEENSKKNKYLPKNIKLTLDELLLEEVSEKSNGASITSIVRKLLEEFNKNKNLRKKIL